MKKTSQLFSFAMLAIVLLFFTACDPNENPKKDAVRLSIGNAIYLGSEYEVGETFVLHIPFDGVNVSIDGNQNVAIEGNGEMMSIEFVSVSAENVFPANGKYKVQEDMELANIIIPGYEFDLGAAMGLPEGMYVYPFGTYMATIADGEYKSWKFVVDGEMTIEGNADNAKLAFKAVYEDGTEVEYVYEGELKFFDPSAPDMSDLEPDPSTVSFDLEPTDKKTFGTADLDFGAYGIKNFGNYYRTGTDCILVELKSRSWDAYILLWAEANSQTPQGVYTVDKTKKANTCWPSPGGNSEMDYFSNFMLWEPGPTSDDDKYLATYYIQSGTLTIDGKDIKGDFITANGSKFNFVYTDEDDIYFNGNENAVPRKVPALKGRAVLSSAVSRTQRR